MSARARSMLPTPAHAAMNLASYACTVCVPPPAGHAWHWKPDRQGDGASGPRSRKDKRSSGVLGAADSRITRLRICDVAAASPCMVSCTLGITITKACHSVPHIGLNRGCAHEKQLLIWECAHPPREGPALRRGSRSPVGPGTSACCWSGPGLRACQSHLRHFGMHCLCNLSRSHTPS